VIRAEIGNCIINFMTDSSDDGNPASKNSIRYPLIINGPEGFKGTTSTTENKGINIRLFISSFNGFGDVCGSVFSLHKGWDNQNVHR
jgi:hypothetical protein